MDISSVILWALPGGPEMILIILALVLLFGGRKIPELMKGLGQGMKEFKKARNEAADNKTEKQDKVDEKSAE